MGPNTSGEFIIGVDLGGTNVRAAVSSRDGMIIGDARRPSLAMEGPDVTVPEIIAVIKDAIKSAGVDKTKICGIGMGVPGRHLPKEGIVLWSPNFKGWDGLQLLAPIREALGLAIYMGNDVNVASLGEFQFGAGKSVNSMVMITLGTGVGGGIVLDGKLWAGANESGGEIGHHIVNPSGVRQCGCGNFGDLESEASCRAIVDRALRKIYTGRKTSLTDKVEPKFLTLTPAMIAEAASEGDELATEVLGETGYFVGIGVTNMINLLNPEMVVIGGGISQAGSALWDPIIRTARANSLKESFEICKIVPAALGDDAGIMGGVMLVLQEMN